MFGNGKAVLEMPADAAASAGGEALGYGGFWRRVAAFFVDWAILMILMIVLLMGVMFLGDVVAIIGNIVIFVVSLLYFPVMESSARQATFGKQLLGMKVTDLDGGRLSFVRALLRYLAKIISGIPFGLGFLLAAFTSRKQALHDIITKCLVVREGPSHFLKAVVAAVGGLVISIGAMGAYVYYMYMPQMQQKEMSQAMDKTMKGTQKGAPAMKPPPTQPPVAMAPAPAPVAKPADTPPPSPKPETQVASATPSAPPVPAAKEAAPPPAKPAAAPVVKAEAAPKPAPEVAAAPAGEKPKPARRVAPRKPAPPAAVAEAPPAPPVRTPRYNDVMTAVMNRDRAGAAEALEMGFWVDRPGSNGVTPLMTAALYGDAAMVQLLLKHGADPNRSARDGSVLDFARRSGDGKIVELLQRAGAR